MSWKLEGTIMIGCNCDWGRPCNVNARPSGDKVVSFMDERAGVEQQEALTTFPEGLVTRSPALFSSKTFRVSDSTAYDHSGRCPAVGPFSYTG